MGASAPFFNFLHITSLSLKLSAPFLGLIELD